MNIDQKILATLGWIAAVKRGESGYLISAEIFDGISTLAEEYKRLVIEKARGSQKPSKAPARRRQKARKRAED